MPISRLKSALKSATKAISKAPSLLQQLGTLHHLALDLAVKKLAWALEHLDEASGDPLVKLALSKGLDIKPTEDVSQDNRVEIVLSSPTPPQENTPESP